MTINAQDTNGVQVLKGPGGRNRSRTQGTRTPDWPAQPVTQPRDPRAEPQQAPVTLEPEGLVEEKIRRQINE